ncbi:MAG: DoxX family protein [Pseudomonadota bacterium]|nr:DoxX family protein [Pseudomonadota bacterium]
MTTAGTLHFLHTPSYVAVMPDYLPWHRELVLLSGALEIAGGLALLVTRLRAAAGVGLILLYIAVLPANVHMALNDIQPLAPTRIPEALLWARIPFQLAFIAWAWVASRPDRATGPR